LTDVTQASFRVRIALNLKGIAHEDSFLHLEKGDQFAAAYQAINPQMVVPTLIDGDIKLLQSLAILEHLDTPSRTRPASPSPPSGWSIAPLSSPCSMRSSPGRRLPSESFRHDPNSPRPCATSLNAALR
jgi:hypothetical protein